MYTEHNITLHHVCHANGREGGRERGSNGGDVVDIGGCGRPRDGGRESARDNSLPYVSHIPGGDVGDVLGGGMEGERARATNPSSMSPTFPEWRERERARDKDSERNKADSKEWKRTGNGCLCRRARRPVIYIILYIILYYIKYKFVSAHGLARLWHFAGAFVPKAALPQRDNRDAYYIVCNVIYKL